MNIIVNGGAAPVAPPNPQIHDRHYDVDVFPARIEKAAMDILVPAHGKVGLSIECIEAIYNFTQAPFHLVFLNAAPADDYGMTESYIRGLQGRYNNITYCRNNQPDWKCGNTFFNVGLKYSKTDITVTCMNSMTVVPGWEATALRLMEADPLIGSIGFKCLFPSGLIESAGLVFVGNLPTDYGRDMPGHWCCDIREAECVQWAFAMHRRRAIEGNLPEDIYNGHVGWDDIDNNFILKSKGWKIVYCGQGAGVHKPRATRGSNSMEAARKNQENGRIFYKRWGLWNQFIEGGKMDVRNVLSHETKAELGTQVNRIQMLQQLAREAEAGIEPMVMKAMAELKVDPGKYSLEMNPSVDVWELKLNAEEVPQATGEAPVASDNGHQSAEKATEAVKT